jgi:hypothetical protein
MGRGCTVLQLPGKKIKNLLKAFWGKPILNMKLDETIRPLGFYGFVQGTKCSMNIMFKNIMFHLTLPDTGGLRVNGTNFQTELFYGKVPWHGCHGANHCIGQRYAGNAKGVKV